MMLKFEVSRTGLIAVAAALLGLWLFVQLWPVVIVLTTSLIFMAAFQPYVVWLERRGLKRSFAVLALLLVVLVILGAMLALVVPAIINEFNHLRQDLPADGRSLDAFLTRFDIHTNLEEQARSFDWGSLVSGRAALSYGEQVVFTAVSVFSVVVITVYLLMDVRRLEEFVFQFVPPGREPELVQVLEALNRVVGGYIRGQFITSGIIGVFTLVVCLVAGVPNPVAFGVIAAVADIIPLAGPFLSIAPATLAALRESPTQALVVFILLLLYQQFEDRILVPRVYSRTLNLPPIIVLVAVLAGGELLGVTGVLLALPAAAAARVALDYYLNRRRVPPATPAEPRDEVLAPD